MDRDTRHAVFRLLDSSPPAGPGERDMIRRRLYRVITDRGCQLDNEAAGLVEVLLDEFVGPG